MALRRADEPKRWTSRFLSSWTTWTLWLGMIVFAAYFGWLSDVKASNFDAHHHDLSHMWQSVWNVAHGHGFEFSLTGDIINVPRLSVHADYFLILFAPLSWIWAQYTGLLVVQAIGVAAGAWFVERIARRWSGDRRVSLAMAVAYLLYGPLQLATLWHFHSVMFAPLLILGAVEAIIYQRRNPVVWIWMILALLTKEQVGLIAGPLLLVIASWSGRRRLGWWLMGVAVTYAIAHFAFIIPAWRESGNSHFVWEFYYGSLGPTFSQQLQGLLNPRVIIERLGQGIHLQNAALLLLPFAGVALRSPLIWLAVLAIVPHWLSDQVSQHTLDSTNHVLSTIVLMIAAIHVVSTRLLKGQWQRRTVLAVLFGMSVIGSLVISPLPWSRYTDELIRQRDPQVAVLRREHRLVPSNAVVGYSRGAGAEFRDRHYAWLLPRGMETLDYAVVFTSARLSTGGKIADQDRRLNEFFRSTAAFETVYTQGRLSIYRRRHDIPLPSPPDLELR